MVIKSYPKKVSLEDVACEQEFLFFFSFRFESERAKKNPSSTLLE